MADPGSTDSNRGHWGRVLRAELSSKTTSLQDISSDTYRNYLGGLGLGARYLWEHMDPGGDPMGPENILGLVPGLLTDTGSLFTGRFLAVGKSPQTGGWGDSNCGGRFSPSLKRCQVDGLFVSGASESPVYLLVSEDGASVEGASDLWGLDAIETEKLLKKRHGKRAQVACIGKAGELGSYLAGICNDGGRIAARSGLGAVMGSKKLKAVVALGRSRVPVAHKDKMKELTRSFKNRIPTSPLLQKALGNHALHITGRFTRISPVFPRQPAELWRQLLGRFGTPALTAMSAESGDSPIKNWAGVGFVDFPFKRARKIGGESVTRYESSKYGCFSCPIRCGGIVSMKGGEHPIHEMHKPEYETLSAFGSLLLNDDLVSIFRVNDLLNRAGMDTISVGGVVAFAIECFENGIISEGDTDGIRLAWSSPDAIVALVEKIIAREGIGDTLADGVKLAAERIGGDSQRFAVHCGGVEAPMHDPKFDPGQALAYLCDATPGRHTTASYQYLELQNLERQFSRAHKLPMISTYRDRYRHQDKMDNLAVDTFYKMLVDGAGVCLFGTQIGGDIPISDWLNAATGWNLSPDTWLVAGERILNLRHCFNLREGIHPLRDFRLHPRLYGDPPQGRGPAKGITLDLDSMAQSFFETLHWDPHTGRPDPAWLRSLGMADVADALA